jgi:transposase-like protein
VFHVDAKKEAVLQAYVECGTVAGAARACGISRQTFYDWIENDESFAKAVVMCRQDLADDLEAEAFKRAREGSDTLLVFLLRAHRPERYRDRHVIEVVSPDVVSRLEQQAAAILEACNQILEDRQLANLVASTIANRLRQIWA